MLSPPNFSRNASASTMAIMASPTTPAAGTAQTSLRSTTASTASFVARSTDLSGVRRVERGFIAARTTTGCPFVTPLQTARIVRLAPEPALGVEEDLVVDRRARAPRGLEAQAQLAALDRLDRAERLREPTVEPAVPLHVGAEPHGAAEGDDLEHAPERVALLSSGVDRLEHRRLGGRIGAADLGGLGAPGELLPRDLEVGGDADPSDLGDMAQDRDPELVEHPLRHARDRHARGRLARARTLEDVPDVVVAILHGA